MSRQIILQALELHCLVMVIVHLVIAGFLLDRGKFNFVSAGFWVWSSSLLLFLVHPLV